MIFTMSVVSLESVDESLNICFGHLDLQLTVRIEKSDWNRMMVSGSDFLSATGFVTVGFQLFEP